MHHAALDVLAGAHIGAMIAGVAGRALFEPVDAVDRGHGGAASLEAG
jgi:hypothetical protein